MRIFVLISTIDEGIRQVPDVLLPTEKDVEYIIVWQQDKVTGLAIPQPLTERADVLVDLMQGHGLCRSRNRALERALGLLKNPLEEVVMVIADDDERFEPKIFATLRDVYGQHPKMDVALLRLRSSRDGSDLKPYPDRWTAYRHRPRTYYPSSLEMTVRSRVFTTGIRFDERFGLGSEALCAGEEDVFLEEVQRRNLCTMIAPVYLATTDGATTGRNLLDTKVLRSKGAVYGYRLSMPMAFLRSLREAASLSVRNGVSLFKLFRQLWWGVKYVKR